MPPSKAQKYHAMLRPMMSYVHGGVVFRDTHVFSRDELLAVTPERIMDYLKTKIYHNIDQIKV